MSTKNNLEIQDEDLDLNRVIDKRGDKESFDEENYDPETVNKIIDELKQEPLTDILNTIKFENKHEEEIFNRLPLSKLQKEEFLINTVCSDEIKEQYKKIKELKLRCDKQSLKSDEQWKARLSPKE